MKALKGKHKKNNKLEQKGCETELLLMQYIPENEVKFAGFWFL